MPGLIGPWWQVYASCCDHCYDNTITLPTSNGLSLMAKIDSIWRPFMKFLSRSPEISGDYPDSQVHGANMGPIWGRQDPGGPHVGLMNFAIWVFQAHLVHVIKGNDRGSCGKVETNDMYKNILGTRRPIQYTDVALPVYKFPLYRHSYLHNWNPYTWKDGVCVEACVQTRGQNLFFVELKIRWVKISWDVPNTVLLSL